MSEGARDGDDDAIGDAGELRLPATELALVILPDTEAVVPPQTLLLGVAPAQRLIRDALGVGFTAAYLAPGVGGRGDDRYRPHRPPGGAEELATGDPIGGPALVVYETATLDRALLRLMVEHPLEEGERFTIYDGVGRPTAWFTGGLARLPVVMPISEEIAWPPELGPDAAARLIYAEDRPRAEALVRRSYGLDGLDRGDTAVYSALLAGPLLRRLAAWGRPIPQLELLALALVIGASGLALLGSRLGLVIGGGALLLGVEVARQIPALRRLRGGDEPALIGEVAIRPLGHGAYTAALTFGMVAVDARSEVADLVLLGLGGAAVFFSLVQARALLRRQAGGLGLPSPAGLAERLGIRWPVRWRIPLVIELAAWVAGLLGLGFVWGVMVAAGLARLWRWFVAPVAESPDVERRSGAIAVEVAERGRR